MGFTEEIKNRKFENEWELAMVNLVYTANWFSHRYKAIFKTFGLLQQHYNVLRIAKGSYPKPVTPGYIREVMIDKGADVTRLVDKLVKMALVDRCQNENNRRMVEIRINEKGLELLEVLKKESETIRKQHYGLDEQESRQLSDLLDKMRKS